MRYLGPQTTHRLQLQNSRPPAPTKQHSSDRSPSFSINYSIVRFFHYKHFPHLSTRNSKLWVVRKSTSYWIGNAGVLRLLYANWENDTCLKASMLCCWLYAKFDISAAVSWTPIFSPSPQNEFLISRKEISLCFNRPRHESSIFLHWLFALQLIKLLGD